EPLDTAVYALWATLAPALKVDVMRESQWEALEALYQPTNGSLFDPPAAPPTDTAPRPLRSVTATPAPPSAPHDMPPLPNSGFGSDRWNKRL
ncbi:phage terminase large subunit family protein, partial [Xylella fastidiosa subsp. multiplex]|nr:phage terminase large subunit family protein [Xylella fastidiosa subsp. multiplex]